MFKRKCIKPKTSRVKKKKKEREREREREKYLAGSSSSKVVLSITSSLVRINLKNNPLNNIGFVSFHLFVHGFKVQAFQIYSKFVLCQVPPQQLKALEVLVEQNSIALVSKLEGLPINIPSWRNLTIGRLKLLILLLHQQLLHLKIVNQILDLFLHLVPIIHGRYQFLPQLGSFNL